MFLRIWLKLWVIIHSTSLRVNHIWGEIRIWWIYKLTFWVLETWRHFFIISIWHAGTWRVQKALVWSHWRVLHILACVHSYISAHIILLLMRAQRCSILLGSTWWQIVLVYQLRIHVGISLLSLKLSP